LVDGFARREGLACWALLVYFKYKLMEKARIWEI